MQIGRKGHSYHMSSKIDSLYALDPDFDWKKFMIIKCFNVANRAMEMESVAFPDNMNSIGTEIPQ